MKPTNKLQLTTVDSVDNSNVFVEVISSAWRSPHKISLNDLLSNVKIDEINVEEKIDNCTLVIDPNTLKIKVNSSLINAPSVHHEFLNKERISINTPPENASEITGLHMRSDSNYIYIWVGNRWKRVMLSEWE